jgi:hypothetical protein
LKGLLREAAAELVFVLDPNVPLLPPGASRLPNSFNRLFGQAGSSPDLNGILHVGDAHLPLQIRRLLREEMRRQDELRLTSDQIFDTVTGIRRQTAMNHLGGPNHGSLRSMRVVLRQVFLVATLSFAKEPLNEDWSLLTGAALGLRAVGTGRNRGRGRVRATLDSEDFMRQHFAGLKQGE